MVDYEEVKTGPSGGVAPTVITATVKGGQCNCCKGTTRSTLADLRPQRVDALYPLIEVSTKLQATEEAVHTEDLATETLCDVGFIPSPVSLKIAQGG